MTVDALAALCVAALTSLAIDTLPLQTALLMPLAWMLGSWLAGSYLHRSLKVQLVDVRKLATTAVTLWAATGVIAQFQPIPGTRAMVLVGVPATGVAVLMARAALLPFARRWSPLASAPVVVVGSAMSVRRFMESSAAKAGTLAPTVAAACLTDDADNAADTGTDLLPELTYSLENLTHAVRAGGADTVVVLDAVAAEKLREFSWQLESLGVGIAVTPLWHVAPHRVGVRTLGDTTLIEVSPPRFYGGRRALRDIGDRVVAGLGLLVLAPLFAVISAAVMLTSRGPVFYRQERTGLSGSRFKLWKFRTMERGADISQTALAARNYYSEGTLFKIRNDPRVTKVGRFLRRTSLDELPQLINVVRGEMALVGPRPTSTRPENMASDYVRRTLVKPGLTGLWQVSGRSNLPWSEAVRLDLHYVENRSIDMDLAVLRRTLPAVLGRDGAY
jgi:exopolysaccharide biosynthesis polyprenyl glycosylphosphotransferase